MTGRWIEGDFEFDFSDALGVQRLDDPAIGMPNDMKDVDFVVEEPFRVLLLEVKDPSNPTIPTGKTPEVSRRERRKRVGDELINDDLVPKARDSYLYLHLMKHDAKEFLFVLLDDPSSLGISAPEVTYFENRLRHRLRHEAKDPWSHHYVSDCIVLNPGNWDTYFPEYPLRRLSSGPASS